MNTKKKRSIFHYTSNCIICGKEFQGTSDHKNRKSQTCTEDACVSKLRSVRQLERRPQDEESKRKRIIERLNKKIVRQDSGCAFWTGCLNACGYGTVGVDGKTKLVHRVIYELYFGPIPEGMVIAHKCDQPACCEITHLFLTDVAGNVYDMIKKGRCKRTEEWNRNNGLARKGMQTRLGAILSDETKKKLSKSITEWNNNRRNVKKNCKFCGVEFIGLPNQLHCGRSCKEKLANKNKRERELKIIKPTRICKFCGKEWIEHTRHCFPADTAAGIFHLQHCITSRNKRSVGILPIFIVFFCKINFTCVNGYYSRFCFHCITGIDDEVHNYLLNLTDIAINTWGWSSKFIMQFSSLRY